jgi:hypothetical protein
MLAKWEDQQRQPGVVLTADEFEWGISYVVQVAPEDCHDDGLRELTEDQIEGVIK